jgi:hypothetical protein
VETITPHDQENVYGIPDRTLSTILYESYLVTKESMRLTRLLSIQSNQQHFQKSVAFGCRLRKYFPCFMDIQTQVILRLVLRYLSAVHATFNQVDQVDPRAIQDL